MQIYNDELYHFGILGMKWGKRKYDGHALTDKEKKGISKEYKSYANKTIDNVNKQRTNIYVKSYNQAANHMNNGGIDKFNKEQLKKHGVNYMNKDNYDKEYMKIFNKKLEVFSQKNLSEVIKNDQNFKKGQELVDKYKMLNWDQLAKDNHQFIK